MISKRGLRGSNKLLISTFGGLTAVFTAAFLCSSIVAMPAAFADNEPTSDARLDVNVNIDPIIAIRALDSTGTNAISDVSVSVLPTTTGAFAKNSFMIQVDTNNKTGYELFMSSDYKTDGTTSTTTPASQADYTNSLVNVPANDSITTLSTDVTETDFSVNNSSYQNKWGVSKSWNETISGDSHTGGDLALYSPVPNHDATVTLRDDVETAVSNSRTSIGVAANVNTEKVSGHYRNKLVFTAIANEVSEPVIIPDFWNITTMQEMTPEVCATVYTPTNTVSMTDANIITLERYNNGDYTVTSDNSSPLVPERTLLDDRDADGTGTKKSYKVRKLADGNCWMVDNLEYDLVGLYNNGKRGIGSKNDGSTFEMTDENLAAGVEGYYTTTDNTYNYVINSDTKPLTNITRYSYLGDVTGQTEYYYNWTAATAGQGSKSDATDGVSIDGSICPAGWRLPTNYKDTTNQNISWSALTNAYLGITEDTNTDTGYQTLEQYPVSLYRAGYMGSGSQDHAAYGAYWSSTTAFLDRYSYGLYYYTSLVHPQDYYAKFVGYQLRCVANPPEKTFWNITTMQEMTPEICATVYTPTNAVSMTDENIITKERYLAGDYTVTSDNSSPLVPERTLLDDRDADGTGTKKSYKVRKLADGNCWMVDNLEYDLLALYNNGKRGIGSKNDGSTFEMTDANLATGVEGYYTTTAYADNYVINPNTKPLTNITRRSYLGDVAGQTEYYYNWTGATAGQGSTSDATDGVSVDGSICPAGWRLPTNYNNTTNQNISWSALTNAYLGFTENTATDTGYQTLEQYPVSLYRAGVVTSGGQGAIAWGFYWSSVANNDNYGYGLRYGTSGVVPQADDDKYSGFQLRCVAPR